MVEALRGHFNTAYDNQDFANLWIDIEYPREKANYPGVWVTYEDTDDLVKAGIDQREFYINDQEELKEATRWRFQGSVSFTAATLNSSYERDRLYDELVRTIAFSGFEGAGSSVFHDRLNSNDFIAMNGNFDEITPSGEAVSPGTPWGTDDLICEKTISFQVIGEFVSSPGDNALVPLSQVQVMGYRDDQLPPAFPDAPPSDQPSGPWTPNVWS